MKFELNNLPRNCSDEEVLAEIRRVDLLVNKTTLKRSDYDKHGRMSSSGIKNRFGDWQKALIAAGLGHKYSGPEISRKMRQQSKDFSDEKILVELKAVARKLGHDYVSQEDLDLHSESISASTVINRFGSWDKGIDRARLKKAPGYKGKFSEDKYFENLLNVWTHHGRQPFLREMDEPPSIISSSAYEGRFGKWRNALESFVVKMNADNGNAGPVSPVVAEEQLKGIEKEQGNCRNGNSEGRRTISLSLRYKVLSRDGFRCVRCGRSPATHVGLELQVDHKEPFSKQGKTVLENLETKCRDCNLGKGNRHSE